MKFKDTNHSAEALTLLDKWFYDEWGKSESFNNAVDPFVVPEPILVFDKAELIAGLAFKMFPSPQDPSNKIMGLWINALLIAPEYRRQKIASKLILHAIDVARNKFANKTIHTQPDQQNLYVYTHLPTLYLKLGWTKVNQVDEFYVLKKEF